MDEACSRRARKKREIRQRLLEAAMRLFCERGYEATTVEDITAAADVAKGTFFNYFETKEAILPALAEWRVEALGRTLLPADRTPVSPVARIKQVLNTLAQDPLVMQLPPHRLSPIISRSGHARPGQALNMLLAELVRQAQTAGEIRVDLDPLYLAGVIRAIFFHHVLMWHCGATTAPLPEALENAVDLLLDGAGGSAWRQKR